MQADEDKQRGPTGLATLLDQWTERMPAIGIATGFADLDRVTDGLHRGELIVLGGRPSMGKTAFASQIALNVAGDASRCVLYVTREVSDTSLAVRMLGTSARLDVHRLRTGRLGEDEGNRIARCIDDLRASSIFIDPCACGSVASIRSVAYDLGTERGALALVIVDALQDFFDPASTEESDRSAVVRDLKRLAAELDCPVLALSNLNRSLERRPNKRPVASDLRGSGVIEDGADVLLFLYRDEVYYPDSQDRGTAEVIIAKQRNGPIGSIRLSFTGGHLRFDELRHDH